MRKLQKRVAKIERRLSKFHNDLDQPLTQEEIAALDEAEENYRSGRTVRLA